jgi:hypothetical protein
MSDLAALREILHHAVDVGCDVLERIERRAGHGPVRAARTDAEHAVNDIDRQFYADRGRRAEFLQLVNQSDEVTDFESAVLRRDGVYAPAAYVAVVPR